MPSPKDLEKREEWKRKLSEAEYNYSSKKCIICGNKFKPNSGVQKICFSEECKKLKEKEKDKRKYQRHKNKIKKNSLENYYKKKKYYKKISSYKFCECGCGTSIPSLTVKGKPNKFVKGHYLKNKKLTKEHIELLRKSHLGKRLSLKTRQKMSKSNSGENHWNWKGGNGRYYGTNWKALSRKIRKRDNYTCQSCRATNQPLDVHHIIPFNISRDNSPENLITYCRSCHTSIDHWWWIKNGKDYIN